VPLLLRELVDHAPNEVQRLILRRLLDVGYRTYAHFVDLSLTRYRDREETKFRPRSHYMSIEWRSARRSAKPPEQSTCQPCIGDSLRCGDNPIVSGQPGPFRRTATWRPVCGYELWVQYPDIESGRAGPEAEQAGLRQGDMVISVNGRRVEGWCDIYGPVRRARTGDHLLFRVNARPLRVVLKKTSRFHCAGSPLLAGSAATLWQRTALCFLPAR
jgi:hypothetical protein